MVVGKLVVFKLGEGNFQEGFSVSLQIGADGFHPFIEITGRLPPAPEIPKYYRYWQLSYYRLGTRLRLGAPTVQVTNVSILDNCWNSAQMVSDSLNAWLNSESLRPVKEKLLETLTPSDEIRMIFQAEDNQLQRLPWHLWDFFERYPKAEIALSTPVYERAETPSFSRKKVKILAVLGNSDGINIQADRTLLKQLTDADVLFLVEPKLKELTDQLWQQSWDILFFAGHSSSQAQGETGRIYINRTDSLTIKQLRYALSNSVQRGLKLAIFNSCDGLGLARELAELSIPQLIVMREPIADRVAQEFLKYFLEAFRRGESFYLAVREARQRLQGLEDQFPCATWLPMICQNPAEVPPTWQELQGRTWSGSHSRWRTPLWSRGSEPIKQSNQVLPARCSFRIVLLASALITACVVGVRHLGVLQPLELRTFDHLLQLRPDEDPDPRLLVVTVTESDIQAQKQEQRQGSLSDHALTQLLDKLEQYQPRVVGLDIYRDFPVGSDYPDLGMRLGQDERLLTVCKVSDPQANDPGIPPPPEILQNRPESLGFSDFVTDSDDDILRRHLLALTPSPTSPCTASYAFNVQLAFLYLAEAGIFPKFTPEGSLQLGNTVFKPLEAPFGGYQRVNAWGHQVLLNYRSHHSPQNIAPQVTLTDVLAGQINPNLVKDRIVLIGATGPSFGDYWSTPYSAEQESHLKMPGVLVQAQMVSQLLSAVLNQRPILWVWPQWGEAFWAWVWSLVGGLLAWYFRSLLLLGLSGAVALSTLYGICLGLLAQGGWIPLIPSALTFIATGGIIVAYSAFRAQRKQ